MMLSVVYVVVRRLIRLALVFSRGDLSASVELVVLRHENAFLCVRYRGLASSRPIGSVSRRRPGFFLAALGRRCATAKARAKGPGLLDYWIARADPDGQMPQTDRVKAAENVKAEFYGRRMRIARAAKRAKAAKRSPKPPAGPPTTA